MGNLKDIKVGDVLIREGFNDITVIFVSGELVICKNKDVKATGNYIISELEEKGCTIKSEPVKEEVKDYLWLEVVENYLYIKYKTNIIGYINPEGKCFILSNKLQQDDYIEWLNSEMSVNNTEVTWKCKQYKINIKHTLININQSYDMCIYDFEYARVIRECKDDNIVRYPVNNTPILY